MNRKQSFLTPRVLQTVEITLEEALLVDSGSQVNNVTITGQRREEYSPYSGEWTMD